MSRTLVVTARGSIVQKIAPGVAASLLMSDLISRDLQYDAVIVREPSPLLYNKAQTEQERQLSQTMLPALAAAGQVFSHLLKTYILYPTRCIFSNLQPR
jgi:hypothetical protein